MNGSHHRILTDAACKLAHVDRAVAALLCEGAASADYLGDVLCDVPFEGAQPKLLGRSLTSFQHFQPGYCWDNDPSLGQLDSLGDAAAWIARAHVSGTQAPLLVECQKQHNATICSFRFPSGARVGSHWSTFPGALERGRALHFVQDACVPHHVWGALLWGHQEWENQIERHWSQLIEALHQADDPGVYFQTFGRLVNEHDESGVRSIGTVGGLIEANAAWTRAKFGEPRELSECSTSDMLDVCSRAVSSTVRAMFLMGVTNAG